MRSGARGGVGDAFTVESRRRRCIEGRKWERAIHSGSCDVGAAGEAQGGGTLPALQGVLNHVLPLVL